MKKIIPISIVVLIISFLLSDFISNLIISYRLSFLDNLMIYISYPVAVFVIILILTKKEAYFKNLTFSFVSAVILAWVLKLVFFTQRPDLAPLIIKASPSFPSAHAAGAFSVIPILVKEFKKLKYLVVSLACLVAFSRIYIGVHTLFDVVFGALLGLYLGCYFRR